MEELLKQIEFVDKHLENMQGVVKMLEEEKIKLYKQLDQLKPKSCK